VTTTRIAVTAGEPRAHVELAVGALAPRLISRDAVRAHIAVTAAGMVLLGGDHVHVEIDVGPGCTLEIEDVGGTVAYRGARSSWILEARIGAGGTLLGLLVGTVAAIVALILVVRLYANYAPGNVWPLYAGLSVVMVVAGLILLKKASAPAKSAS